MKGIKIREDLYWVGVYDPNLEIFDIVIPTDILCIRVNNSLSNSLCIIFSHSFCATYCMFYIRFAQLIVSDISSVPSYIPSKWI